jgi:hypothetical protein
MWLIILFLVAVFSSLKQFNGPNKEEVKVSYYLVITSA